MNVQQVDSSRRRNLRWLSPLIPLLLACSSVTSPHEERALGSIAGYDAGDPQIEIITDAGSVIVQVITYGNSCYRQGETEVEVQGMEAEVTPYDYIRGRVCDDILLAFSHEAEVEFDTPGQAQIVVRGVDIVGDTLRVERTVVVE